MADHAEILQYLTSWRDDIRATYDFISTPEWMMGVNIDIDVPSVIGVNVTHNIIPLDVIRLPWNFIMVNALADFGDNNPCQLTVSWPSSRTQHYQDEQGQLRFSGTRMPVTLCLPDIWEDQVTCTVPTTSQSRVTGKIWIGYRRCATQNIASVFHGS